MAPPRQGQLALGRRRPTHTRANGLAGDQRGVGAGRSRAAPEGPPAGGGRAQDPAAANRPCHLLRPRCVASRPQHTAGVGGAGARWPAQGRGRAAAADSRPQLPAREGCCRVSWHPDDPRGWGGWAPHDPRWGRHRPTWGWGHPGRPLYDNQLGHRLPSGGPPAQGQLAMGVAIALFLLSPVTLLAWAAGQAFLRVTGLRWWKLALACLD